jgi:hypothetical protein
LRAYHNLEAAYDVPAVQEWQARRIARDAHLPSHYNLITQQVGLRRSMSGALPLRKDKSRTRSR